MDCHSLNSKIRWIGTHSEHGSPFLKTKNLNSLLIHLNLSYCTNPINSYSHCDRYVEFQFLHPYKWGVTRYADRFSYTPRMGPDTFRDDVRQQKHAQIRQEMYCMKGHTGQNQNFLYSTLHVTLHVAHFDSASGA
jgi:hypothetical protein